MHAFINFLAVMFFLGSIASGTPACYYASSIRKWGIASGTPAYYYGSGIRKWGDDTANLVASIRYQALFFTLFIASMMIVHFNGLKIEDGYAGFFQYPSAFAVMGFTSITIYAVMKMNKARRAKAISRLHYLKSMAFYLFTLVATYGALAYFWSVTLNLS